MFISYHLNKGYCAFTPRAEHVETLPAPGESYTVKRLKQNYYYNSKTDKISRETKTIGESFISFDGKTFISLPWHIANGSEEFYLNAIKHNAAKIEANQGEEETARRIANAAVLQVA